MTNNKTISVSFSRNIQADVGTTMPKAKKSLSLNQAKTGDKIFA